MKRLETDRLILCPFQLKDREEIHRHMMLVSLYLKQF